MTIKFVQFRSPVNFGSVGVEHWSATDTRSDGISVLDKGSHLQFTVIVRNKRRVVKVPLTNIGQVTLEEDEPSKEES